MDALLAGWRVELSVVIGVAVAMVLGGAIGFERELKDRPAGFRTHMLIAGAAALLVGLADLLAVQFTATAYHELVRIEPIGVIQATVAAVGFLGAGTIFRSEQGSVVSGITTAASLLMAASIGISAGLHRYALAVAATLLTLVVLLAVSAVEKRLRKGETAGK